MDRGNAQLRHDITRFFKQDSSGMIATIPPKRGHGIHERTAKKNKIGPAHQRLNNIKTGLDTTINNKRQVVANHRTDGRKPFKRVWCRVKLAATVI